MIIDVLTNDGSPLGVMPSDVFGSNGRIGVGGAELALFTMCEAWVNEGHRVRLYNNPRLPSETLEQLPLDAFHKRDRRDHLIVFRSPNIRAEGATGQRIWWSCDQKTVGDFQAFSAHVHKVVVISEFHRRHFQQTYGIRNTLVIDLPVRTCEYADTPSPPKTPRQLLFSSVPARGLSIVAAIYPAIHRAVPDVSLVVTSDYRLWGGGPNNEHFREVLAALPNVRFLGAVPRDRLVDAQRRSDVLLYPCIFPELFCLAVAEAQVSGALPITSDMGALGTTNMGIVVTGTPQGLGWREMFVGTVVSYLTNPQLSKIQTKIQARAIARFNVETVSRQWHERVFNAE